MQVNKSIFREWALLGSVFKFKLNDDLFNIQFPKNIIFIEKQGFQKHIPSGAYIRYCHYILFRFKFIITMHTLEAFLAT
jgi:hypothetical protein